jgi:flavin-binding protein dodecin
MAARIPPYLTEIHTQREEERVMAKKGGNAVYRVTEVIGTSTNSWEDAARNAVKTASSTLRDLRIAEIEKLDVRLDEKGEIVQFRARVALSFKYEG